MLVLNAETGCVLVVQHGRYGHDMRILWLHEESDSIVWQEYTNTLYTFLLFAGRHAERGTMTASTKLRVTTTAADDDDDDDDDDDVDDGDKMKISPD